MRLRAVAGAIGLLAGLAALSMLWHGGGYSGGGTVAVGAGQGATVPPPPAQQQQQQQQQQRKTGTLRRRGAEEMRELLRNLTALNSRLKEEAATVVAAKPTDTTDPSPPLPPPAAAPPAVKKEKGHVRRQETAAQALAAAAESKAPEAQTPPEAPEAPPPRPPVTPPIMASAPIAPVAPAPPKKLPAGLQPLGPHPPARIKALIFTMDSISAYGDHARRGGPAGEIAIRTALEEALRHFGVEPVVATSDNDFARWTKRCDEFAIVIVDPWTWVGPGNQAKPCIRGNEAKVFILDFFGARSLSRPGLSLSPKRFLTAFPTTPWNTYLGYYIDPMRLQHFEPDLGLYAQRSRIIGKPLEKKAQGVIWGKTSRHWKGKESLIRYLADRVQLHATVSDGKPVGHPNIKYHGHLTPEQWSNLLADSRFVLGLGDPLLGPSAVDAVASGCVYINPKYPRPVRDVYDSQHPFMAKSVGPPYVCSASLQNHEEVWACVRQSLSATLPPMIPKELTRDAYLERVSLIFKDFLR